MRTTKLLVLAYFALLISLVASHETSTQKPKRKQRYRIVKVYTRRFKNNATAQAQLLSTAQPLQVIPAERWAYRQKLKTSEEKPELPREMLQGEADSSRNTVNLGQMDLENFDVGKLLAAAGHVTGGDPLAPTVIRFSAPSGDSQLDPEYLSKILREQLGQDAQFQIMPASGNAGDNANFRQIYNAKPSSSAEQNSKQQGRQNFNPTPQQKLNPTPQQNLTPPPQQNLPPPLQNSKHAPAARPAPPVHHFSKENTFPAVLQNGKAVEIKNHGTSYQGHQVTTPANHIPGFSTTANHNSAYSTTANNNPAYHSTTELPKTHYSKPTKKYPLYPRNPTGSQGANFSGFKIQTGIPTQPPKIQNPDFFAGHSSFTSAVEAAAGYSTLSQEMTAPGLAPAVTGQYPDWNKGHEGQQSTSTATTDQQGKKYSTTFVRGFTDKEVGQPLPPGQQGQVPSGQPQKEASQVTKVKVLPEGRHYNPGPTQKAEPNLKISAPKARVEPTGSASSAQAWEASGYYKGQQSEETGQQGSSESWGGQHHSQHAQSHDAGKLKFGPSKIEYGPPPPSGGYSDYQSESPPAEYGPPPHHPKITKTIYINLPPEGASTTSTPKPYKHHNHYVLPQKHYKIVFIKAPTAPPTEEPEIELPPPTPQTKTIIYVLHKKPEPPKKVVITAPPSTEPPSPEVFFIQYNDKQKQKSEEANNESGWNKPKNDGGWSKPETPKWEQKNQGWSKPVPKSEEPKNHGWKSTSSEQSKPEQKTHGWKSTNSEQSKPEQKNTGWGKYEPTQSVQWGDVQDQGGWSKPETTVNSVWEKQKSQVWGNPVPSTGTSTGWDSEPTTQEETDSDWTKDDKNSGSGWSTGTDSKWEDHKTWSTGPDTGTKWNEPKNQGWSSNSKPGKVEKLEVSRESSSWGRPKINSEGWSPIFSGKEHQNYDDHTQGYAEDGYQAAASASAPMRVSVIKTVTTKICAHNKPC